MMIFHNTISAQNNMAAVSAQGSTVSLLAINLLVRVKIPLGYSATIWMRGARAGP